MGRYPVGAGADATVSTKGELTFADFVRDARSLLDAVLAAIGAVESVNDAEVLHADPDAGWPRSSLTNLTAVRPTRVAIRSIQALGFPE